MENEYNNKQIEQNQHKLSIHTSNNVNIEGKLGSLPPIITFNFSQIQVLPLVTEKKKLNKSKKVQDDKSLNIYRERLKEMVNCFNCNKLIHKIDSVLCNDEYLCIDCGVIYIIENKKVKYEFKKERLEFSFEKNIFKSPYWNEELDDPIECKRCKTVNKWLLTSRRNENIINYNCLFCTVKMKIRNRVEKKIKEIEC